MIPKQIIAGVVVNLSSVVAALCMGWSSSMFPLLSSDGPENPTGTAQTVETLAEIGSRLAVGAMIAPFFGGYLADKMGRKKTLLTNSAFFIFSYLLMAVHPVLESILIARLLQGFGVGISMTVQAMYIGEIASNDLRGGLGSFMNLFMTLGFLIINCVGPYFPFVVVQEILLIFPCLFIVLFAVMPESPYYLVTQNRHEDALKSLAWLRNSKTSQEVCDELLQIKNITSETESNVGEDLKTLFQERSNLKALTICVFLIAAQQLSGINAIYFYASSIFAESGSEIDSNVAVIILCAVQVLAALLTPFVADKWGRKTLLLFSSGASAGFLGAFALYKYGITNGVDSITTLHFLPLTSMIGYLISFSCGLASMPWALVSELFTPRIKKLATPINACTAFSATFLVTRYFQPLSLVIGSHWMFVIFFSWAIAAFIFTKCFVFETKGLSLLDVQLKLDKSIRK